MKMRMGQIKSPLKKKETITMSLLGIIAVNMIVQTEKDIGSFPIANAESMTNIEVRFSRAITSRGSSRRLEIK